MMYVLFMLQCYLAKGIEEGEQDTHYLLVTNKNKYLAGLISHEFAILKISQEEIPPSTTQEQEP